MATCQGCGAEVFWKHNSKTGKRAPVNARPDPEGNVVLEGRDTYRVLTKAEMTPDLFSGPPGDRYTLHFATCPNAPHFRRCGTCHREPCQCPK